MPGSKRESSRRGSADFLGNPICLRVPTKVYPNPRARWNTLLSPRRICPVPQIWGFPMGAKLELHLQQRRLWQCDCPKRQPSPEERQEAQRMKLPRWRIHLFPPPLYPMCQCLRGLVNRGYQRQAQPNNASQLGPNHSTQMEIGRSKPLPRRILLAPRFQMISMKQPFHSSHYR